MNDDVRKGSRNQLVGLNLWVVCIFIGSLVFMVFMSSPIGFLLVLAILFIFVIGFIRFYSGLFFLIRGTPWKKGKRFGYLGGFMVAFSPFFIFLAFISPEPINYFMMIIGIWLFLSSFIMPYLRHGGLITGIAALLCTTTLSILIIGFIFSDSSLPWLLPVTILGLYFIFLELTVFICYLKAMEKEEDEGLPDRIQKKNALAPIFRSSPVPRKATVDGPAPAFSPDGSPDERGTAGPDTRFPFTILSESDLEPPGPELRKVTSFEDFVKEMGAPPQRSRVESPTGDRSFKAVHKEAEPKKVEAEVEEEIDLDMEDVLVDGLDLYQILKVARNASSGDLRRAYRQRALLYHPDRNPGAGQLYREAVADEMRKLNKAKEVLFDPVKRSIYDRELRSSK